MRGFMRRLATEETGHLTPLITGVLGAVGVLVLAFGATDDNNTLVWIGAVAVAAGFLNAAVVEHIKVDYPLYARVDALEERK